LSANLVTLSACDTGIGKLQGEEGVTNLVQAFFLAGAKAVVASLWAADDSDTTSLMEHFYRHLAQKEDKATALQHAKFDLVQKYADQAPPFYWAGFVMAGEGSTAIPVGNP
jgi:CHAT domain-containing protein